MSESLYKKDPIIGEVYGKDTSNNEIYESTNDKTKVFAKNLDLSYRYAKKFNGDEYYPLDPNTGDEWYIETRYATLYNGNQIYPTQKGFGEKILDIDPPYVKFGTSFRYPKYYYNSEYYAQDSQGTDIPIDGLYAKDENDNDVYPKDRLNNDIIIKDSNGEEIYAQTKEKLKIYPKETDGTEFLIGDEYIVDAEGNYVYPYNGDGTPIYPGDVFSQKEIYLPRNFPDIYYPHITNQITFAKEKNGTAEVYAHDFDWNEIYPETGQFAYSPELDEYLYAVNNKGEILFPTDKHGNETYVFNPRKNQDVIFHKSIQLPRYAKAQNGKEKYPVMHTYHGPREIHFGKYAVDEKKNRLSS